MEKNFRSPYTGACGHYIVIKNIKTIDKSWIVKFTLDKKYKKFIVERINLN